MYIYKFEECLRPFLEPHAKDANCKGDGNKCCNKVAKAVPLLYPPKYAAHDCYQEYFLKPLFVQLPNSLLPTQLLVLLRFCELCFFN